MIISDKYLWHYYEFTWLMKSVVGRLDIDSVMLYSTMACKRLHLHVVHISNTLFALCNILIITDKECAVMHTERIRCIWVMLL